MLTYTIQCFIETLANNNQITLRGSDGYRLLKDDKNYLVFIENGSSSSKSIMLEEQTTITINFNQNELEKILDMTSENFFSRLYSRSIFLFAQLNRKKVELEVEEPDEDNTFKLIKIKLLQ